MRNVCFKEICSAFCACKYNLKTNIEDIISHYHNEQKTRGVKTTIAILKKTLHIDYFAHLVIEFIDRVFSIIAIRLFKSP